MCASSIDPCYGCIDINLDILHFVSRLRAAHLSMSDLVILIISAGSCYYSLAANNLQDRVPSSELLFLISLIDRQQSSAIKPLPLTFTGVCATLVVVIITEHSIFG